MEEIKVQKDKIAFRFGGSDTPAPNGIISSVPRITVAVSPADPRIKVAIVVRMEQKEKSFNLRPVRKTREEQFYEGTFPALREGDKLQYYVKISIQYAERVFEFSSIDVIGGIREIQFGIVRQPDVEVTPSGSQLGNAPIVTKLEGVPLPPKSPSNSRNNAFSVSGKVLNGAGKPMIGQKLIAFDIDLIGAGYYRKIKSLSEISAKGGMNKLGEDVSDHKGNYFIQFANDDFQNSEVGLADVIVYVVDKDSVLGMSLLANRKDYYNHSDIRNWNVIIESETTQGESEYKSLISILQPFISKSKLTLAQIADSEDQIKFLANEVELPVGHIEVAALSEKLSNQVEGMRADLIYGLGREGVMLDWSSISKLGVSAILRHLDRASAENIISPMYPFGQVHLF
jgi:hypothetical protein